MCGLEADSTSISHYEPIWGCCASIPAVPMSIVRAFERILARARQPARYRGRRVPDEFEVEDEAIEPHRRDTPDSTWRAGDIACLQPISSDRADKRIIATTVV